MHAAGLVLPVVNRLLPAAIVVPRNSNHGDFDSILNQKLCGTAVVEDLCVHCEWLSSRGGWC